MSLTKFGLAQHNARPVLETLKHSWNLIVECNHSHNQRVHMHVTVQWTACELQIPRFKVDQIRRVPVLPSQEAYHIYFIVTTVSAALWVLSLNLYTLCRTHL